MRQEIPIVLWENFLKSEKVLEIKHDKKQGLRKCINKKLIAKFVVKNILEKYDQKCKVTCTHNYFNKNGQRKVNYWSGLFKCNKCKTTYNGFITDMPEETSEFIVIVLESKESNSSRCNTKGAVELENLYSLAFPRQNVISKF